MVTSVDAFHPATYAFGFWKEIQEGFVGHVYESGALQDTFLEPGLHFLPFAYFGTTVELFDITEDSDCFGCTDSDKMCSPTKEGTFWCVSVTLKNQVSAQDSVEVVRAQKRNYDKRLGGFMKSSVAEVIALKTNLEMRQTTSLNEEILDEFLDTVQKGWGQKIAGKIQCKSLLTETKDCMDASLRKQWAEQVSMEASKTTILLTSKTEAAQHAKNEAAATAAAKKLLIDTNAQNSRQTADATNKAAVQGIADAAMVATAVAQVKVAAIKAAQILDAQIDQAELLRSNPEAARHAYAMAQTEAIGKMTKVVDLAGLNSIPTAMRALYDGTPSSASSSFF